MPGSKELGNMRGVPGKSAFELAVEHGFEGSEADWLFSLNGGPEAVNDWLAAHPEATSTVQDGSITRQKLNAELVSELSYTDSDLNQAGKPADAKVVGERFDNIMEEIETDTTLKQAGKPADAKAAGDAVDALAEVASSAAAVASAAQSQSAETKARLEVAVSAFTKDSEVADARVDRDGFTSESLHAAITAQIIHAQNGVADANEHAEICAACASSTGGHVRPLALAQTRRLARLKYNSQTSKIEEYGGKLLFSDFVKCPRYLFIHFANPVLSNIVIYFYRKSGDNYVQTWDVLDVTGADGVKNDLHLLDNVTMIEVPYDNVYMRVHTAGTVKMFGWDGTPCGEQFSANYAYITASNEVTVDNASGYFGILAPKDAIVFLAKNIGIQSVYGCRNSKPVSGRDLLYEAYDDRGNPHPCHAFTFPETHEYLYFYLSCKSLSQSENVVKEKQNGGLYGEGVMVTRTEAIIRGVGSAKRIAADAAIVNGIEWTPKRDIDIDVNSGVSSGKFKAGVKYHGLPYSSYWYKPNYVGWHITPHTFVNAMNDEDSVIYNERRSASAHTWPYYGIVCSAYATLCRGHDMLASNPTFFYSPYYTTEHFSDFPLAEIITNGGHCFIPQGKAMHGDFASISVSESQDPVCGTYTKFDNIIATDDLSFSDLYSGRGYSNYGYVAKRKNFHPEGIAAPYANFEDVDIANGKARPYKGDRCVYTSEEDIRINIKDANAQVLRYQRFDYDTETGELTPHDSTVRDVPISGKSVNVPKEYLSDGGIYGVWTDSDGKNIEYFEYRVATPVLAYIDNGDLVTGEGAEDCWYFLAYLKGHPVYNDNAKHPTIVPVKSDGDYSDWRFDGHYFTEVKSIFKKGTFGAYTVPIVTPGVN